MATERSVVEKQNGQSDAANKHNASDLGSLFKDDSENAPVPLAVGQPEPGDCV